MAVEQLSVFLTSWNVSDELGNSNRLWCFQVAGDTEVKAQIRLQFHDITGQKCMVIRSLIATQKVFLHLMAQIFYCQWYCLFEPQYVIHFVTCNLLPYYFST